MIILLIAVVSSVLVLMRTGSSDQEHGLEMWTFTRNHYAMFVPVVDEWNEERDASEQVDLQLIAGEALLRRMMSGFVSGTPVAEVVEIERSMATRVFAGPLEDVGLVDLTDRLKSEGLLEQFNPPSLTPWMKQGRVFGLPHDVHPVLLAYRSDLVEEAGIDVDQIETWDDFARVMKPLIQDVDGDGRPDRYPLSIWPTSSGQIEALILQNGGGYFGPDGQPTLDLESNAQVIAQVVAWCGGPDRIAADAPEFSASGNAARLEGYVVASIMPDWLSGVYQLDMPTLSGKLKLMPMPAWEPGGRRTGVWGGSMLGIPKQTVEKGKFDEAWAYAKMLYTSPELAERLYRKSGIVSPFRGLWDSAYYDEPVEFFSGQPAGRLYLNHAEQVPARYSSPFQTYATGRFQGAVFAVWQHAQQTNTWDRDALMPVALKELAEAQELTLRQIRRNVFAREEVAAPGEDSP